MTANSKQDKSKDKKEPSETVGVVLPPNLFQRAIRIQNKHGYTSMSEVGREAFRMLCDYREKADTGIEVWQTIGGEIIGKTKDLMDNRVEELTRMLDNLKKQVVGLEKERDMLDSLPPLDQTDAQNLSEDE